MTPQPVVWDIETGPIDSVMLDAMMPEFKPVPKTLVDPDKIRASIEKQRAEFIDEAALSAVTGKVLCIGIWDELGFGILEAEKEEFLLSKFWARFMKANVSFVGFNSNKFDLPFLIRRSWKLGIPVPLVQSGRYFDRRFVDLMEIWQAGDRQETISLARLAMFLGVGEKLGSGKDFAGLWQTDPAAAAAYLKQDLLLTRKCAEKMGVLNFAPDPVKWSDGPVAAQGGLL